MASIRQWIAWVERRLEALVVTEGLHVGLTGVTQGPLTVTFRLRLLRPTPRALKKLLGLGPALAQALQVDGVRIDDTARGVLVEVPSPQPRTPSGRDLARQTQGLTVAVGLDQWRRPVRVDLRQHPALLFVGPTRRGKTSAMKSALYALARQNPSDLQTGQGLRYVIVGPKRQDWVAFGDAAGCLSVVSDPSEAVQVLEWAAGRLLPQRSGGGQRGTAVLLVIDDLVNLLKRVPQIAAPMGELASMGGGVNLFQLIGTQHAGSKSGTGGSEVEDNITVRVVYKPSSATAGARSAGVGGLGLEQLSGRKGDALLVLDGHPMRVATGYTSDRVIVQLPGGRSDKMMRDRAEDEAKAKAEEEVVEAEGLSWAGGLGVAELGWDASRDNQVQPVQPVAPTGEVVVTWPISRRPPTVEEAAAMRAMKAAEQLSLNKLCFRCYGFKDGAVLGWVKEAVEDDRMTR